MQPESEGEGTTWLEHQDGRVSIHELSGGRRKVVIHPSPEAFVARPECITGYPTELIAQIVRAKSPGYVCDEIMREEDPDYVALFLAYGLLGYVAEESFRGARILDFGSGSGASTVVLARMFPESEIVGVELEDKLIEVAEMRARHYRLSNITFLQSTDPETLPSDLGSFSFINLGAVYEHLLPDERRQLLPQLWSRLEVGGVIFVNQLPYRFYPIEAHTTGLPLLNYLPDRWAHRAATRFSPRIAPDATWAELLRDGIRGGTARSVHADLVGGGGEALSLAPAAMGLNDHADLWFAYSSRARSHPAKRLMRLAFKVIGAVTGEPFAPGLSLAFRKRA